LDTLNPLLGEALAFRGGTALYKLHITPAARYSGPDFPDESNVW
jgi:predicted nucleotidyltransferase component of viral defense system